jgi:hypothetical protein
MRSESAALVLVLPAFGLGLVKGEAGSRPDLSRIERLTGAKASVDAREGTVTVALPHSGLPPRRPQVRMAPRLGPESWVTFEASDGQTTIEGALVVSEERADATLSAALDAGLEIVALQQQFVWDHPKILRLQVRGRGNEEALATAVGTLFARMRQTPGTGRELASVKTEPVRPALIPVVDVGLGVKGDLTDGVYRVSLGSDATWATFTGSLNRAVVAGDIVVDKADLQELLRRLRTGGFSVVAIEAEAPGRESLCVHYWGLGQGQALVQGLRSALSKAGSAPSRGR